MICVSLNDAIVIGEVNGVSGEVNGVSEEVNGVSGEVKTTMGRKGEHIIPILVFSHTIHSCHIDAIPHAVLFALFLPLSHHPQHRHLRPFGAVLLLCTLFIHHPSLHSQGLLLMPIRSLFLTLPRFPLSLYSLFPIQNRCIHREQERYPSLAWVDRTER